VVVLNSRCSSHHQPPRSFKFASDLLAGIAAPFAGAAADDVIIDDQKTVARR
jgi:hypothetical protein